MEALHQARPRGPDASLPEIYEAWRPAIKERLADFAAVWRRGEDEELFAEMAFCLCAVQTGAARCDAAVRSLQADNLLLAGSSREVARALVAHGVRFHWTKGERIVRARQQFFDPAPTLRRRLEARATEAQDLRDWLQEQVVGLGWKEASHYLRNIGLGHELAILDRHILRNLRRLGVIDAVPASLSRAKYLEIEAAMGRFCGDIGVPMAHLDLLLWARETGYVLK